MKTKHNSKRHPWQAWLCGWRLAGLALGAMTLISPLGALAGDPAREATAPPGGPLDFADPVWEEVDAIARLSYRANRRDCSNKNAEAARILRRQGYAADLYICRALNRVIKGIAGFDVRMDHAVVRVRGETDRVFWVDATGPRLKIHDRLPFYLGRPRLVPEDEWLDEATAGPEWRWPSPK